MSVDLAFYKILSEHHSRETKKGTPTTDTDVAINLLRSGMWHAMGKRKHERR